MNESMTRRQSIVRICTTAVSLTAASTTWSEPAFPSRLIRIFVPVPAGGGTDTIARLIADKLRVKTGQPVIVENRAGGASGSVGAEYVARSAPDGYTLLLAAPGPIAFNKFLYPKLGYEPTDFVPVSVVASIGSVLMVQSGSPFKSVAELIAYARANPGKLTYASGGLGTTVHLASELFKKLSRTDILHVPYKGDAASTLGLMQGQVDMKFGEISTTLPHIKSGRVRVLAVGDDTRNPVLPDVPTVAETLPGFRNYLWYGVVAPPKTPKEIAAKLSAWMVEILADPEIVEKMKDINIQPVGSSAADMGKLVRRETEHWGGVIRSMKITAE